MVSLALICATPPSTSFSMAHSIGLWDKAKMLFLIKRTSRASEEIVQDVGWKSGPGGRRGNVRQCRRRLFRNIARTTQSALTFCAPLRRPVLHLEAPGHDRQHPRVQHLTRYETHVLQQHPWSARTRCLTPCIQKSSNRTGEPQRTLVLGNSNAVTELHVPNTLLM